jgi:hypothetical protein
MRDPVKLGSTGWLVLALVPVLVGSFALGEAEKVPALGPNASLHGKAVFPADDAWNQDISAAPVDPDSEKIIAGIGLDKPLHPDWGPSPNSGIPYVVVGGDQAKVPIKIVAALGESDPGPYPVPADAPVEGGRKSEGDRHVLVIDRDHWVLYELYRAFPQADGLAWTADSTAMFDLAHPKPRPAGWTSADAAGLPVFAGLVRYDEAVEQKVIPHAVRFTVRKTRRAYIAPARHFASRSNDANLPPMGMRVRLKASVDIGGYPPECQAVLTALKKYGMIVADNGGDWFVTGAPDPRWNEENLNMLKRIKGRDFEVVKIEGVVVR